MKACGNKKAPFEILQIHITDSLYHLWQLPEDFIGNILLFIENGGFRSVPEVKGNHLGMEAFGRPLTHGITGFDDKFDGLVELVIDDGLLSRVVFSEENLSQSDKYQHAFLAWYPMWEAEEKARMILHGKANRFHGKRIDGMNILQKLKSRSRLSRKPESSFIAWGVNQITGEAAYTKPVITIWRKGGLRSTVPVMPKGIDRKELEEFFSSLLPNDRFDGKIILTMNQGLVNDLNYEFT